MPFVLTTVQTRLKQGLRGIWLSIVFASDLLLDNLAGTGNI